MFGKASFYRFVYKTNLLQITLEINASLLIDYKMHFACIDLLTGCDRGLYPLYRLYLYRF